MHKITKLTHYFPFPYTLLIKKSTMAVSGLIKLYAHELDDIVVLKPKAFNECALGI